MILFDKFGQHRPLNRQSERYVQEAIDLPLSTLADQVGACVHALRPLHHLIAAHVLAAERLHGDDTTVPILAKGRTVTGRIWTYVRDDRPFGGPSPPAALYHASPDRTAAQPEEHPRDWIGILQADAYSGYGCLCAAGRNPGPPTQALCWVHARRKFFELADIAENARRGKNAAPISHMALEAVKRIDALFAIEREASGLPAPERLAIRRERSVPLLADFEEWMRTERARLSRHADVAKAMDSMLTRVGRLHPLHHRRAHLPVEQRGRASPARHRARSTHLDLRRLTAWRRPLRFHADDDRHRQAQRYRPADLARRRPCPHRRYPTGSTVGTPALELGRVNAD